LLWPYYQGMDETLLNLLIDKNLALPGNRPLLLVILGPYAAAQAMLTLAAHLARAGPLQVLDGGNRFNAYIVARQLRRLCTFDKASNSPDLRICLDRIRVARAFTCYQMAALIEDTPPSNLPSLVIDLLDTFYDESAPLPERRSLIEHCMQLLHGLSSLAPTIASVRPPQPSQADPTGLLEIVENAGDLLWLPEEPVAAHGTRHQPAQSPAPPQMTLF
jgi:hypothetical protein